MSRALLKICVVLLGTICLPSTAAAETPAELFERNLRPILDSPASSSCRQCHLAGVELKNYIAPTHEGTFRSLRDQGLIDLDQPDESRILALIHMQQGAPAAGSARSTAAAPSSRDKRRQAEYAAFREWIAASVKDRQLVGLPPLGREQQARPAAPDEVIRHARRDRVLESFENNVWAFRFRCMSCHIEGSPENEKHRKEHGDRVAWIKRDGPAATLAYLLSADLIDLERPEQSLLLLKPLGEVEHGGGKKFVPGDLGYQAFRRWIEDYVKTVQGEYKSAGDLPPRDEMERFGSESWLKLADTPPEWGDKLLRVDLYAWDASAGRWESEMIASTDRMVWGKGKLWQHTLTLYAPRGSRLARQWKDSPPALPPGKYLANVYVARREPSVERWQDSKADYEYVGQAEVESQWPTGYGKMTTIEARKVKK